MSILKYIVIREDDVCYFTKLDCLEKLYGPLFAEQKAINFSVIPNVNGNIKVPANNPYKLQEGLEHDPMIPPKYRGNDNNYPVDQNKELVEFIKNHKNCQVLQHGYTHELINEQPEFSSKDEIEIQRRSILGKRILQNFFPEITFFVPPWDVISPQAIRALKSNYKGLSTGNLTPSIFDPKALSAYLSMKIFRRKHKLCDRLLIVEHKGYLLTKFADPKSIYENFLKKINTQKIIFIVNHHWEYFFDWNGLNSPLFQVWQRILKYLLEKENLEFLTYDQLYFRVLDHSL